MHPKALALHNAGLEHQLQGEFEKAKEAYLQALALDARMDASRFNLATVLEELKDPEAALTQYQTLLDYQPGSFTVMLGLVRALGALERFAEAQDALQRLLAKDPDDPQLLKVRDWLVSRAGSPEPAPVPPSERLQQAQEALGRGETSEAVATLREAIAHAPSDLRAHLLLAETLGRAGDGEGAWLAYAEVTARQPDMPGLRERLIALCRQQARNPATSQPTRWWERLKGLQPTDAEAAQALEQTYLSQSRITDLIRLLQTQAAQSPEPTVVLRLGEALVAMNRTEEALGVYRKALADHPEAHALREAAATLAMRMQRPGEARAILSEAPDLSPEARLLSARAAFEEGRGEEGWGALAPQLTSEALSEQARAAGAAFARPFARRLGTELKDLGGAVTWWRRLLDCLPGDPEALANLEALYRHLERPLELADILAMRAPADVSPEKLLWVVEGCARLGRPDHAHAALSRLAARAADPRFARMHLARLCLQMGQPTRAWQELEPLLQQPTAEVAPLAAEAASAIALKLQETGDYPKAVGWWKLHLHYHPQSPDLKKIADAQLAAGDLAGASATMRDWVRRNPQDEETMLTLAGFELEEGRYAEAGALFQTILQRNPNHLQAVQGMAEVAAGMGNDDAALTWTQRLIEISHDELPQRIQAASEALGQGQPEQAWSQLKQVLATDPGHAEAMGLARFCLEQLANRAGGEASRAWWQELLSLDPRHAEALRSLARLDAAAGRRGEATRRYLELQAIDPSDPETALWLGRWHLDEGRRDEARQALSHSPQVHDRLEGMLILAELAVHDGDFPQARALFGQAVEASQAEASRLAVTASPFTVVALTGLARACLALGSLSEAWDVFKQLLATPEGPKVQDDAVACLRGLIQAHAGMAAIPYWEELLAIAPASLEAHRAVATLQLEAGNPDAAMAHAKLALGLAPADRDTLRLLAEVLKAQGRTAEAAEVLVKVASMGSLEAVQALFRMDHARALRLLEDWLQKAPERIDLRRLAADWSMETGDHARAWPHLQALLAQGADEGTSKRAAACLERLASGARTPEEGLAWWQTLLELDPDHPQALSVMIRHHRSHGQPERARELISRLMALGADSPEVALSLGASFEAQNQLEEARKAYAQAAQAQIPEAFVALGRLAMQAGESRQAQTLLERAVKLDPARETQLPYAKACLSNGEALKAWKALEPWIASEAEARTLARTALDRLLATSHGLEALGWWQQRLRLDPTDLEAHEALFRHALAAGDLVTQATHAPAVLSLRPRDPDAALALGLARAARGEDADDLLAIASDANRPLAFLPLGWSACRKGDHAAAHAWLDRHLQHLPETIDALRLRVAVAHGEGRAEDEWLGLDHLQAVTSDPEWAEAKRRLVRSQLRSLPLAEAEAWIDRAILLEDWDLLEAQAQRGLEDGALEPARGIFQAIRQQAPERLDSQIGFGRAARGLGDRPAALEAYLAAFSQGAQDPTVLEAILELNAEEGRFEEAHAWAQRLLERDPAHARAQELLCEACRELARRAGAPEEQQKWWYALLQLAPEDVEALRMAAAISRALGDPGNAARLLGKLHQIRPRDLGVLLSLADACQETGNTPAARKALELAQAIDPEDLGLRARLASALIAEGNAAGAEAALREILERDPENPHALRLLAGLKVQADPEEALSLLEQALSMGDDAHLRALAVQCAEHLARGLSGPEALEAWRRLLRLDPAHMEANRAVASDRMAAGRPDEALSALFALVKQAPDPGTLFDLARALQACRQPAEATAVYRTLADQYDFIPAWQALGEITQAAGDFQGMREVAQRLLQERVPGAEALAVHASRQLALQADRKGDVEAAHHAWSDVLAFAPEDTEALYGLACAAEGRGQPEEAIATLRRLVPLDATPRASVKLAENLMKRGQEEEAERLFALALAADPEEPHAHAALARLAQGRGDFLNAGDHAQRALARMPDEKLKVLAGYCARQLAEASRLKREIDEAFLFSDLWAAYAGKTLDWRRFRAELARDAGRQEMAIALYRSILVSHPDALEDALSLTRCYDDARDARPLLEALLAERPSATAAAHALATLALDEDDVDGAITWWTHALAHAPQNASIWRRVADTNRRSGRYPEACEAYARLAELVTADPLLLKSWGNAALSGELWEEARKPYGRLAREHGDRAAELVLAQVATTLEDYPDAWHWTQRLLASGSPPPEAEELAMTAAKALAERAQGQESLDWWERYLALAPGDLDAHRQKGLLLQQMERLEEAIATFLHALELAPGDGPTLRMLADVQRQAGRIDAAEETLNTALAEDPRDGEALFALAEIAWDRGQVQRVWELGQQMLSLNNRNPKAQNLIARCAKLLAEEATAQQDWENAILYWELLLSFDIDEETALQHLSQAYVSAGRYAEAVGIQRELIRLHPEDPDRRFRLGEIAVMGGFWDEARQTFLELRDADPTHVPTHHALASVALATDDLEGAEGHFLDVLAQEASDLKARIGLARLYMGDRPEQAWDVLKPAASEPPVKGEVAMLAYMALDRLADDADDAGRPQDAVEHRRAAVALDPEAREWRRKLAASLVKAGRKPEAIRELASLLESDAGDVEASYLLGGIHRQSSDLESASRVFERILELQPGHVEARIALAEIGWEISDFEGAWAHVQEALQLAPTHEGGLSLFRKLCLTFADRAQQEGNLSESIQWWNLVWHQDKRDLETLRKMARAHISLGQLTAAADCYAFALDLDPKDLETAHILADIHRQRGDLKAAEKPLLRIVALDPRHAPSLRALLKLARDRQNAPEALKRAYDLLDVEPDDAESLFVMAWAHLQMLERRAALEACKELVAVEPNHAEGLHLMGQIARDLGDYDLAKKAMTTALYLRPCAPYYHTMGTIYAAMGLTEEAHASYNQALSLDPEHPEAHADLGLGLIRARQVERAKPHLQKALSMLPKDSERGLAILCALDLT